MGRGRGEGLQTLNPMSSVFRRRVNQSARAVYETIEKKGVLGAWRHSRQLLNPQRTLRGRDEELVRRAFEEVLEQLPGWRGRLDHMGITADELDAKDWLSFRRWLCALDDPPSRENDAASLEFAHWVLPRWRKRLAAGLRSWEREEIVRLGREAGVSGRLSDLDWLVLRELLHHADEDSRQRFTDGYLDGLIRERMDGLLDRASSLAREFTRDDFHPQAWTPIWVEGDVIRRTYHLADPRRRGKWTLCGRAISHHAVLDAEGLSHERGPNDFLLIPGSRAAWRENAKRRCSRCAEKGSYPEEGRRMRFGLLGNEGLDDEIRKRMRDKLLGIAERDGNEAAEPAAAARAFAERAKQAEESALREARLAIAGRLEEEVLRGSAGDAWRRLGLPGREARRWLRERAGRRRMLFAHGALPKPEREALRPLLAGLLEEGISSSRRRERVVEHLWAIEPPTDQDESGPDAERG